MEKLSILKSISYAFQRDLLITVWPYGSEYPLFLTLLFACSWLRLAQDDNSIASCRWLGYNDHLHYKICVELGDQFVTSIPYEDY